MHACKRVQMQTSYLSVVKLPVCAAAPNQLLVRLNRHCSRRVKRFYVTHAFKSLAGRRGASCRAFKVLAFESGEEVEEDLMERIEKCIGSVKRNFSTIRTGRASPDMLDRIEVDYYGAPTPLRQLAGISVPESTSLLVQPYDKGSMQSIEKAIQTSDLGLTPNNDGKVIRLNIPQLTAERRKELAKQASKMAEDGKVAVRNVRRDSMKAVGALKNEGMSEDEVKALEDSVQEYIDDAVKQIEDLLKKKQDDLTKV